MFRWEPSIGLPHDGGDGGVGSSHGDRVAQPFGLAPSHAGDTPMGASPLRYYVIPTISLSIGKAGYLGSLYGGVVTSVYLPAIQPQHGTGLSHRSQAAARARSLRRWRCCNPQSRTARRPGGTVSAFGRPVDLRRSATPASEGRFRFRPGRRFRSPVRGRSRGGRCSRAMSRAGAPSGGAAPGSPSWLSREAQLAVAAHAFPCCKSAGAAMRCRKTRVA